MKTSNKKRQMIINMAKTTEALVPMSDWPSSSHGRERLEQTL